MLGALGRRGKIRNCLACRRAALEKYFWVCSLLWCHDADEVLLLIKLGFCFCDLFTSILTSYLLHHFLSTTYSISGALERLQCYRKVIEVHLASLAPFS